METELYKLTTISVRLYGDSSSIIKFQIKHSKSTKADLILTKVCQLVGLAENSRPYFTLVEGSVTPTKRYKSSDDITLPCQELTLYKWTFDIATEEILLTDPVAVQLLCKHASYNFRGNHILAPLTDQNKSNELLAGPQYLTLCQSLPCYNTILFKECSFKESFKPPQHYFSETALVDIGLSKTGLEIICDKDQTSLAFAWREVQNWSIFKEQSEMKFSLMLCGSRSVLHFKTHQLLFLWSILMEVISLQLNEINKPTKYFASNIRKSEGWTIYENLLYDPGVANPVYDESPTNDLPISDLNLSDVGIKLS